jgi:hypothetical protein
MQRSSRLGDVSLSGPRSALTAAPGRQPQPTRIGASKQHTIAGKIMGNKIVTEADRKRSPAPKPTEGYTIHRDGGGQKVSLERGKATRSKKNPGKRPHKGG